LISQRLRDRDAILTKEGIIFRVYGYSHPPNAYICDPEYASAAIDKSEDPRAYRAKNNVVYYKFFSDEGLRFVQENYPQYLILYKPLRKWIVGVKKKQIAEIRQPNRGLNALLREKGSDTLLQALQDLISLLEQRTSLSRNDFGVFGSLLHGFYHASFSDLDLTIYGTRQQEGLRESLSALFEEDTSGLRNEFNTRGSVEQKHWRFLNYSLEEYVWHQRRKQIYALFNHRRSARTIKTEFEPVKRFAEFQNEYSPRTKIQRLGWIKLHARITDDTEAPFIPSIYRIEPVKILKGPDNDKVDRIVSYIEEFRLQAHQDELVEVEGNLEKVTTPKRAFNQITLTYDPRYYEQTLKVVKKKSSSTHFQV
jgi:predicted nucleotidyltransferase